MSKKVINYSHSNHVGGKIPIMKYTDSEKDKLILDLLVDIFPLDRMIEMHNNIIKFNEDVYDKVNTAKRVLQILYREEDSRMDRMLSSITKGVDEADKRVYLRKFYIESMVKYIFGELKKRISIPDFSELEDSVVKIISDKPERLNHPSFHNTLLDIIKTSSAMELYYRERYDRRDFVERHLPLIDISTFNWNIVDMNERFYLLENDSKRYFKINSDFELEEIDKSMKATNYISDNVSKYDINRGLLTYNIKFSDYVTIPYYAFKLHTYLPIFELVNECVTSNIDKELGKYLNNFLIRYDSNTYNFIGLSFVANVLNLAIFMDKFFDLLEILYSQPDGSIINETDDDYESKIDQFVALFNDINLPNIYDLNKYGKLLKTIKVNKENSVLDYQLEYTKSGRKSTLRTLQNDSGIRQLENIEKIGFYRDIENSDSDYLDLLVNEFGLLVALLNRLNYCNEFYMHLGRHFTSIKPEISIDKLFLANYYDCRIQRHHISGFLPINFVQQVGNIVSHSNGDIGLDKRRMDNIMTKLNPQVPILYDYSQTKYLDVSYSDCVENTILQFLKLIFWDTRMQKYDLGDELLVHPEVHDHFIKVIQKERLQSSIDKWSRVVVNMISETDMLSLFMSKKRTSDSAYNNVELKACVSNFLNFLGLVFKIDNEDYYIRIEYNGNDSHEINYLDIPLDNIDSSIDMRVAILNEVLRVFGKQITVKMTGKTECEIDVIIGSIKKRIVISSSHAHFIDISDINIPSFNIDDIVRYNTNTISYAIYYYHNKPDGMDRIKEIVNDSPLLLNRNSTPLSFVIHYYGEIIRSRRVDDKFAIDINNLVKLLMTDRNRDIVDSLKKTTPLHDIIESEYRGHYDDRVIIDLITDKNKDIKNERGCTPLHLATQGWNNIEVIKRLISPRNRNTVDNYDNTPLHLAVRNGADHGVIIELLTPENKNMKDYYGNTPLHLAINSNQSEEIIRALLTSENKTMVDSGGNTPLQLAAMNRMSSNILQLLSITLSPFYSSQPYIPSTFKNIFDDDDDVDHGYYRKYLKYKNKYQELKNKHKLEK